YLAGCLRTDVNFILQAIRSAGRFGWLLASSALRGCQAPERAHTRNVDLTLFERPLFYIGRHYVTFLGLIAFVGLFAAGFIIARVFQSQFVRRFFSRFKLDTN